MDQVAHRSRAQHGWSFKNNLPTWPPWEQEEGMWSVEFKNSNQTN